MNIFRIHYPSITLSNWFRQKNTFASYGKLAFGRSRCTSLCPFSCIFYRSSRGKDRYFGCSRRVFLLFSILKGPFQIWPSQVIIWPPEELILASTGVWCLATLCQKCSKFGLGRNWALSWGLIQNSIHFRNSRNIISSFSEQPDQVDPFKVVHMPTTEKRACLESRRSVNQQTFLQLQITVT